MRVCVVGSGGREHALALALARSANVVVTPGNPGMQGTSPWGHSIESSSSEPQELEADLYVIGPEAPLVSGLADLLRSKGRAVVGPSREGALLEGSKVFMKQILDSAGIPTAPWREINSLEEAKEAFSCFGPPYVVKTDGLAAGKGVLVTRSYEEALMDAEAKLSGRSFGKAGQRLVIEQAMEGEELSVMAICDGKNAVCLPGAQDFKRAWDNDEGPNTGGMGSYAPVPQAMVERAGQEILGPLLTELTRRGIDYRGVLYAGLMATTEGLKVVEINVRFGDPEAQVVLPSVSASLLQVMIEAASGSLSSKEIESDGLDRVCVVLAAEGYPENPRNGVDLDLLWSSTRELGSGNVQVLHAGTKLQDGKLISAGGRVLNVVASGDSLTAARAAAYQVAESICPPGLFFRRDIALEAARAQEASSREAWAGQAEIRSQESQPHQGQDAPPQEARAGRPADSQGVQL